MNRSFRGLLFASMLFTATSALGQGTTSISALPSATTPLSGTESVPLVQGGVTKKAPASAFTGTAANPTATIGASAVNGTASTYMRSDAAPALPATLPALDASNLTSLTAANLLGTLPAISGANLTNLTPANLATAVPVNKGGTGQTSAGAAAVTAICGATGTPSSSTFLRGDCAWATPAGSGNVSGPGSAVSGNLASYNGTTGTLIQDGGIAASSVVTLTGSQTITGKSISGATNTITAIPLSALTNLGTTTTVLHGNAAGSPTFSAVSLTADVSGILPSANGGAGSVSGIMKANGSGTTSAAVSGTDYQSPITLTTTGTSGAATFVGNTLNIPQYTGGGGSGTVTSITCGSGLSCTGSNPITTSGTITPTVTLNAQTGTTYTFLTADCGKLVSTSNGSAIATTLPAASTTGFTSGCGIDINDIGTGANTITTSTSVFDNGLSTLLVSKGQYANVWSDSTNWHSALTLPVMAVDSILGNFSGAANYPIAGALTSCSSGSSALTYNTSTHAFGCNTISGSGTVNSGTANQLAYYAGSGTAVSGTTPGTGVLTALGVNANAAGGFCVLGANACAYKTATIGWVATVNPNNTGVIILPSGATLISIVGNVETATGGTATVSVNVASSGTACSAGTTVHSGSFNANGTAATNQTLTLTTTAITSGQRLCLQTTGTTSWTGGTGIGTLTITYTAP